MARRAAKRVLAPVESFLRVEASSGIVLLLAAMAALAWANSPAAHAYEALWHIPIGLSAGSWSFERSLHFWINEGLMTIFFFVVGLEIRREVHRGELSDLRRASLPVAAALGGMILPALVFLAFNHGRASMDGWGVPMATDIAFAVGVLALLGKRVPPALRVLLLALAVIDDIGAILVIALFYSSGFALLGFVVLGAGMAAILIMQKVGVRSPWAYVAPAVVVWAGVYGASIHPTLAGVIVGLLTPVRAWFGEEHFLERAEASLERVRSESVQGGSDMLHKLEGLDRARREAVSPVERLEHALHGWVAFGIMPLFAFANAGVQLGSVSLDGSALRVFGGVGLGLLVGKPLGVMALAFASTRLGWARLPAGVRWHQVLVVGLAAGVGFTMALFIAQLAFTSREQLEVAKLAILCASGAAAVLTYVAGRLWLHGPQAGGATSAQEAEESSTR